MTRALSFSAKRVSIKQKISLLSFVILSVSEISIELKHTLILWILRLKPQYDKKKSFWILRFLAKAQYDNFI